VRIRTAALASLAVHAGVAWWVAPWHARSGLPRSSGPATPVTAPVALRAQAIEAEIEAEIEEEIAPLQVVLIDRDPADHDPLDSRAAAVRGLASVGATAAPAPVGSSAALIGSTEASAGSDRAHPASASAAAPGDRVAPSGDAAIASTAAGGEPARRGSLAMRGPDLALPATVRDRIAGETGGPPVVRRSGRVVPSGGGTARIDDRVTTVRIARDGTVRFEDKPDFEIHIALPTPGQLRDYAAAAGRHVATWYADPYAQTRVGTMDDVPEHLAIHPGDCDRWGDACSREIRARSRKPADEIPPLIWGKFEFSDAMIRAFSGDPYASRKRKLLDESRDERAELGAQHRAEDLARSAELALRNLEALWRTTRDPAARRDALFAMWDECDEGDTADGDAGRRARAMVIGWIRAKLPPGSPDAFGADEIAARSAHRRSRQPFAPYE
jgi:hypothetical protein